MPKKTNINISAITVIRIIVFLLIGFIAFSAYTRTREFLTTSPIFQVHDVMIDSSIQFIDVRALKQLRGRNIFKVDIKKLERRIANDYPQISQLRIERQLPDRIKVLAKKREPIAQISMRGKYLVIDQEGVSINYALQPLAVPVLFGVPLDRFKVVLGAKVPTKEVKTLLTILNEFKSRPRLSKLTISLIDGANLSKIEVTLVPNVHIIIDQDQTLAKIDMLEMLLTQNRLDLSRIKYIDIRFKEPVIADNPEDTTIKGKESKNAKENGKD